MSAALSTQNPTTAVTTTMNGNGSYELYDGKMVHLMNNSLEDQLMSPPGGPALHPPPASPKQTREIEELKSELKRITLESSHRKRVIEDLQRKAQFGGLGDSHFNNLDENVKENSSDSDVKDSQIRHLQRQVTILQADIYKKEGLEQRMKEMTKEKNVLEDQLRAMAARRDEAMRETGLMHRQNKELEIAVQAQNEEIQRLMRERTLEKTRTSALIKESYDSNSPPSSRHNSPPHSTGIQSMSSSSSSLSSSYTSYTRELESLHKMVDMLKATVIDQRNVFIKMGLSSRNFHSMPQGQEQVANRVDSNLHPSSQVNISTPAAILTTAATTQPTSSAGAVTVSARPVRQAEESNEKSSSSPSPYSDNGVIRTSSHAQKNVHSVASRRDSSERSNALPVSSSSSSPRLPPPSHPLGDNINGDTNHVAMGAVAAIGGSSSNNRSHANARTTSSSSPSAASSSKSNFPYQLLPQQHQLPHHHHHHPLQQNILAPSGVPRQEFALPGNSVNDNNNGDLLAHLNLNDTDIIDLPPSNLKLDVFSNPSASRKSVSPLPSSSNENEREEIYVNDTTSMNIMHRSQGLRKDIPVGPNQTGNGLNHRTPVSPSRPAARKVSHSEIIDRRPQVLEGVTLPVKSRTEILGKNPNMTSHPAQYQQRGDNNIVFTPPLPQQQQYMPEGERLGAQLRHPHHVQSEPIRPQYPPEIPRLRGGGVVSAMGGLPTSPDVWMNNSNTNDQRIGGALHQNLSPSPQFDVLSRTASAAVVTNHSNTLSNVSDVPSSSPSPSSSSISSSHPIQQQQQTHNSSGGGSNRLCPVCSQSFNHISMEDFQTHVYDCFENENGPETLQAEGTMASDYQHPSPTHPPPQPLPPMGTRGVGVGLRGQSRTCPMCQQSFETVSQTEFEQHVHRHFGEEQFEVIGH